MGKRKFCPHFTPVFRRPIAGRYVEWPFLKLKNYMYEKGMRGIDWIRYTHDYQVREKLEANPKLCQMKVEKLKETIEKK